jgi:hypothetical protein
VPSDGLLADFESPVWSEPLLASALCDESLGFGTSCTPEPVDAEGDGDGAGAALLAGAGVGEGAGEGEGEGLAAAAWFCDSMLCCRVVENGTALLAFEPPELPLAGLPFVTSSSELINEKGDMLGLVWSCQSDTG